MESSSIQSSPAPQRAEHIDERQKTRLKAAVKDFESVFVGYMLKSMRSSLNTKDMFGESFGGDLMEGMFDSEFARFLTKGKSFGLGEMLFRQLLGPESTAAATPANLKEAPAKSEAPAASKSQPESVNSPANGRVRKFDSIIQEAADRHQVDADLIRAVIASESAGDRRAESPAAAKGVMQLMDSTATEMGVRNVWNPRENILGGTRYLKMLMDRYGGDLTLALASYNAGPGTVERYGGVPPYKETRDYIDRVTHFLELFKSEGAENGIDG